MESKQEKKASRLKFDGILVEIVVLCAIYGAYQIGYWVAGTREIALHNANLVYSFEKFLGIAFERPLQDLFLQNSTDSVVRMVNRFYMYAHVPCTLLFFLWVYRNHQKRYHEIRNGFIVAHVITVTIEVLFPCAPPRMLNELGFVDTILIYSKMQLMQVEEAVKINPYAAMPSMHFGYAAVVGIWGFMLSSNRIQKNLFLCYTTAVFITIIITGNHFVLDAVVAGEVLLLGYWINQHKLWKTYVLRHKEPLEDLCSKVV